ncbi:MAG: hypothetical protein B6D41_21280 [Chloroflexi bacterium UTCFX4]|jgi:type I restriction-modification system DNA methylase subunit|nr:MAG: hypothetical protein B6D41_21280 [Chloroflexi bacterium UTCFX4]
MPTLSESDIRHIRNLETLFDFLRDKLSWEIRDDLAPEDFFYDYTADELHLDKTTAEQVTVRQIAPFVDEQPWGIFLVETNTPRVYTTHLRQILRALAPSARAQRPNQKAWRAENLLFVCVTPQYDSFTFAHFKGEKAATAKLASFGWDEQEIGLRTLREFNLPALEWYRGDDAREWIAKWSGAFDVEKVTNEFFREYEETFAWIKKELRVKRGVNRKMADERRHEFTQRLMNRLLFLCFLQKKRWLNDNPRYLYDLYDQCIEIGRNFYDDYLFFVLFWGLNNAEGTAPTGMSKRALDERIGKVPFLNGGLFDQMDEWDAPQQIDFSDEIFARLLGPDGLLRRYNFTVTESTPLDIQVAVDPEMLGKVFERLITKRHDTGSYYTPKTVVQFMCREALKKYLGGYEKLIDERRADALTLPQARAVLAKLDAVQVVDPACGSGAYILGMLHELFDLTEKLEIRAEQMTAQDAYKRKLKIIQNNLYGVDLDDFAVNIARLRLWLSLIIEFEGETPPPLPNLDFKIETGDTLTVPAPSGALQSDLIRHQQIEHFKALKAAYLQAHTKADKENLKQQIAAQRGAIKEYLHGALRTQGFDWWVEFAEVFENGGFDVVVANPPYGASVEDKVRDYYFNPRNENEKGQSKDTYGLFIARALQLLRADGQFCFIVSDTWRTIKTHRPLRKRLLETTTVQHVLDLPSWIFNATVNTCILTLTKAPASADHKLVAGDLRGIENGDWQTLSENLIAVAAHGADVQTLNYAHYTYPQSLVSSYGNCSFFVASPHLYAILSDRRFTRLGEVADAVHGISTGNNRKYVRAEQSAHGRYEIIEDWMKMPVEEMKQLSSTQKIRGVDKDWRALRGCFVPFEKGGESNASEGWLPNYHVPTQYYVNWARGALADMRKNPGFAWKNERFFFKKGLTFSISGIYAPTFRLNSEGLFEAKGSGIFSENIALEILLAFLSSRFARYQFKSFIKHTVDTSGDDIKEFRFPTPNDEEGAKLKNLVDSIVSKQKSEPKYPYHLHEQKEIDALVYQLYGLDENDIREVELWYCRRYPKLAHAQGVTAEVREKYASYLEWAENVQKKPPYYWTSHPILKLIAQGEGEHLEFKETLEADAGTGAAHPGVLVGALKTIAAYLNTDGGTLLIGVSDTLEIRGLDKDYRLVGRHQNADGLEQKIRSLLNTRFAPAPLGLVHIHFHHLPEGTVCEIEVGKSNAVIHLDGSVYVRDGNGTRKLEGVALTQWLTQRAQTN